MYKVFPPVGHTDSTVKVIRKMVFENAVGFYPSPAMSRSKRPDISFPNVKNLYLVGDAVNTAGIGGTSDIAFTSAIKVRDVIISNKATLALNAQASERSMGWVDE